MKNSIITKVAVCAFMLFTLSVKINAQTNQPQPTSSFKVTADLVSSYVWRGVNAADATGAKAIGPHFQPTFAFTNGNFEIGAWASTNFDGHYKEIDPYITYTVGAITLTATDYDWSFTNSYFNYKNEETNHIIEGSVTYKVSAFSVQVATMLYGADKKYSKDLGGQDVTKQNYSTYVEFDYAFPRFTAFLGATPANGYYGNGYGDIGFGVVNMGLTSSKTLKITDKFELPLKATLGVNPQAENIYLVFAITF